MDPRDSSTAPTGSRAPRGPPIVVREISARQTYDLRHDVLWPDKPMAYVQLPDDEAGQHFGAFISSRKGGCEMGSNHDGYHNEDRNADPDQDNASDANDDSSAKDNNASHSGCGSGSGPPLKPSPLEAQAETQAETETEELVSVISLFIDEGGSAPTTARFRKFATARAWQGRGVGSKLLAHTIAAAASSGATRIWCDARASALPFYRRFGMGGEEGEVFFKGDVPYLRVSRALP
ncbi:hypothetical protein F4805DRAFT_114025 [Annulohypoxylon moriforme]|nr:hypothetical protein F4805DRAFT_114025 [Annulohypoxylon moriforme]